MRRKVIAALSVLVLLASPGRGEEVVTQIRAVHRHGQTFITWKDVADGEAGARYRYTLLRSTEPITADNAGKAEACCEGVFNHSAKLFGSAFNLKDRLNPDKPTSTIEPGGKPLPMWSGLAVHTVRKKGRAYYAVVATDDRRTRLSKVVPGQSATMTAVDEAVSPIQPIKLHDSQSRGVYSKQTSISGKKGLPLFVELHASQGQGGGAGDYGDYYLYFATPEMGWRDGLPGVFSVEEQRGKSGNTLLLRTRDAVEHPSGTRAMETYWFGYWCVPHGSVEKEPRAHPFTEQRLKWIIDWVVKTYDVDADRIYVGGGSMGAWGTTTFGLRHPERFAALYPNRPRTRQRGLPDLIGSAGKTKKPLMADGTEYFERMDMVKHVAAARGDLPFFGWCCGRHDGFATWQEQIDMVKALTAAHHGFAFAWNDGDHSSGSKPMEEIRKFYPPERFARNATYPAFGNSSLDDRLGSGDPKDGDPKGGINLGFHWTVVVDEEARWSVRIGNPLAKEAMTVDVTPRRCAKFRVRAGDKVRWTTSSGGNGTVNADEAGLVTVPKVAIKPGVDTEVTLARP